MPPASTIFALTTPAGRGGVAVIRISGPDAIAMGLLLSGKVSVEPRRVIRASFRDPLNSDNLDDGLFVSFPKPNSYTGEDVAELHLHGSPAVVAAVVAVLGRSPSLRLAEPGEFTRRAFENGKLDLTAAEAVADLVAAETEAQRRQALRQLGGELGALYEAWRADLIGALARLEACVDFPDEDLPKDIVSNQKQTLARLATDIRGHLADKRRGERLRDGLNVAIVGAPNAGKSSLLNRLARRDAAIVSAAAGTTRDVIEIHLDLGGYPAIVADTAGLREAADDIEREGVRRALARAETADLKIAVFDATVGALPDPATAAVVDSNTLSVVNKADLCPLPDGLSVAGRSVRPISALTGAGIDGLLADLERELRTRLELSAAPALTRARHRAALEECAAALDRAREAAAMELVAEDLRLAARALGRITGRVDVENVLDVVFRDFCIGK